MMFFPCARTSKEFAHADAVFVVRGRFLFPEHLGDDAEHGTAVPAEHAAARKRTSMSPKCIPAPQGFSPAALRSSRTAEKGSFLRSATATARSCSLAAPSFPATTRSRRRDSS